MILDGEAPTTLCHKTICDISCISTIFGRDVVRILFANIDVIPENKF